ncbi:MAG: CCA tRNA nucleotidyltransferase, partial [Chloroflexi bacterium]|nr:CCA tRNA nucleotidyltransferase [Chloroflexota bacterium]
MTEGYPRADRRTAAIDEYIERHPIIRRVFELAAKRQVPLYLVGGSVRDMLLGAETHDFDFAVEGDGLALGRYVANTLRGAYVPLDKERRTARVLLSPQDTARFYPPLTGTPPSGHVPAPPSQGLCLDIAALRGDSLEADLRDRDFTINAMALGRAVGERWVLFDPLHGSEDLANKVLRPGSPSSFVDDPVRTLRAARMHIQFGCAIEPDTRELMRCAVPLLGLVSAERVRDEWFKILDLPGAAGALRTMH